MNTWSNLAETIFDKLDRRDERYWYVEREVMDFRRGDCQSNAERRRRLIREIQAAEERLAEFREMLRLFILPATTVKIDYGTDVLKTTEFSAVLRQPIELLPFSVWIGPEQARPIYR